jgi:hypothetical protein
MGDRTTRKLWMRQKMQQEGKRANTKLSQQRCSPQERVLEFVSTGCALAGRNGSA